MVTSCSVSPGLCVMCSIGCILMSSTVCPGKLKCLAMKVLACFLIEERWPDRRSLTFLFVSPTYCWSHLAQLIRYITLVVEQERSQALITVYWRRVKELRKKRKGWITAQVAQRQIWVVTRHQYGISVLVSQTSFGGEASGSVAKCRLFSQAIFYLTRK